MNADSSFIKKRINRHERKNTQRKAGIIYSILLILCFIYCEKQESNRAIHPEVVTAMQILEQNKKQMQKDPYIPVYHFHPPAGWIGDLNAPVYYNDAFHIFYQHKPDPKMNTGYWGHAVSKDLIHWEHLPIALWPSPEIEEKRCFSGDIWITPSQTPIILYTSVPSFEQYGAMGDEKLITWEKHPDNPLLTQDIHGDSTRIGLWRDPFFFEYDSELYMITGGWVGSERKPGKSKGIVALYQAEKSDLSQWTYLGPLFSHPISKDCACPNLFPLEDKWILLMSRHNPHVMDYFVGHWDQKDGKFRADTSGVLGYTEATYATQGLYDQNGRLIIWSTLHNWRSTGRVKNWNGCLTLPRRVVLLKDGTLGFRPVRELKTLRDKHTHWTDIFLENDSKMLDLTGDVLELRIVIKPGSAKEFGVRVRKSTDGKRNVTIQYDSVLTVDGKQGLFNDPDPIRKPIRLKSDEKKLKLHIFLDKAVIEIYVNDRLCIERLVHPDMNEPGLPLPEDVGIELFAQQGDVTIETIDCWTMKSIWK